MTLPGTTVTTRESQAASSANIDTSTAFFVGLSGRGPIDEAVLCRNIAQVEAVIGDRSDGQVLYDAADVFFREGGSRLYLSRVVGPNPSVATVNLVDGGAVETVRVDASSPGSWGANLDVEIVAGTNAGEFRIQVSLSDTLVESSPDLVDKSELVAWAANSDYIRVTDLGAGVDPAVGTDSLTGGSDDRNNATEDEWSDALARFTTDLGPGQVAAPGRTTTTVHGNLLSHAAARNRFAILDLADTATVATLTAEAATQRATGNGRYGFAVAPWAVVPGVAAGTTRTVPYSAVQAGLIARSESRGNNPNVPAAGENGRSLYAIGLSQAPWTDAQRETLNDAGVNVALLRAGSVRTYGYRTLVNPLTQPNLLQASGARTLMALAADCSEAGEGFEFSQIDGKGIKLSEYQGELLAICSEYYDDGALYGGTLQEAAKVDVGAQVNTPESLAEGILRALVAVRISPFAERVVIEITKVPNTEAIA